MQLATRLLFRADLPCEVVEQFVIDNDGSRLLVEGALHCIAKRAAYGRPAGLCSAVEATEDHIEEGSMHWTKPVEQQFADHDVHPEAAKSASLILRDEDVMHGWRMARLSGADIGYDDFKEAVSYVVAALQARGVVRR